MSLDSPVDELESRLQRLRAYLRSDPANPYLLCDCLSLALQLQNQEIAGELAAHASNIPEPRPARLLAVLALFHFREQHHDVSLQLLECAYPEPAPCPLDANILMARNLHHLGRMDDALARLFALPPTDNIDMQIEALGLRALLACDNGDAETAIADAHQCLEISPNQPDALLAMADALKDTDDYTNAAAYYQQLLQQNEFSGRAWSGLAQTLLAELDFASAEICVNKALACMTDHIGTWHVLAWIHVLKGEPGAARAAFVKSLAIDRSFAETHGGLAVVDAMEGKRADAEQKIRIAERLDKNSFALHYARMLLLGQQGDSVAIDSLVRDVLGRKMPGTRHTGLEQIAKRLATLQSARANH